jgi:ribosome-associated protein
MDELSLDGREFIALCDLLKRTGMCENGGHAKAVIAQGEVSVDDKVELRKRCKIIVDQTVTYNEQTIKIVK